MVSVLETSLGLRSMCAAVATISLCPFLSSCDAVRRPALVVGLGGLSGQGEKDLVQGGLAEGDVLDLDLGGLEGAQRGQQPVARVVDADGDAARCLVDLGAAV